VSDTNAQTPHRGRFQVLDDVTRRPIAGHPYTMKSSDGRTVQGKTDANGFTEWLDGNKGSSLVFSHPGSESAE
jgi:uncharacterized protein (DUF2345 family)